MSTAIISPAANNEGGFGRVGLQFAHVHSQQFYSDGVQYPAPGAIALKTELPAAPVNADWNANNGLAQILNKPNLGLYVTQAAGAMQRLAVTGTQANTISTQTDPASVRWVTNFINDCTPAVDDSGDSVAGQFVNNKLGPRLQATLWGSQSSAYAKEGAVTYLVGGYCKISQQDASVVNTGRAAWVHAEGSYTTLIGNYITIDSATATTKWGVYVKGAVPSYFGGDVQLPSVSIQSGAFLATISGNLTANRALIAPDASGTIALTSDIAVFAERTSDGPAITSSTTLADDSVLQVSLAAGATYQIEACWIMAGTTNTGSKVALRYTGAADSYVRNETRVWNQTSGATIAASLGLWSATVTDSGGSGTNPMVFIRKGVITTTTAGTLIMQVAQNTSSADTLKNKAGAYLLASRSK